MHLCYDDAMIYCFAFGFVTIYCHGSCRCSIDDYAVIHDRNGVPYKVAAFDVYAVVLPSVKKNVI